MLICISTYLCVLISQVRLHELAPVVHRYICVLILLCMCPHIIKLLHMRPHTAYICVLIPPAVHRCGAPQVVVEALRTHDTMCVPSLLLIILHMCSHATGLWSLRRSARTQGTRRLSICGGSARGFESTGTRWCLLLQSCTTMRRLPAPTPLKPIVNTGFVSAIHVSAYYHMCVLIGAGS